MVWEHFHPVAAKWFGSRMGEPTDVQKQAWPQILDGKHTLIAAPTGSGKTLAALLPCLDRLVHAKLASKSWKPGVRILYVTPLKALNNDIHLHIGGFINQLKHTAKQMDLDWPELTVGVRTGDTSQSTRSSMIRKPPDLLVTTPESLYIILTSERARKMLGTVEQIIIDEIHDLAADKRGMHLMVSLERLVELCGYSPQRIGVSATQKPIQRMALFLGGWEPVEPKAELERYIVQEEVEKESGDKDERIGARYVQRPVTIIESPMERLVELTVTLTQRAGLGRGEERVWQPILDRLMALIQSSSTALVFVNNRRMCERLALRLNEYAGSEVARSHHGSVSREKRLEVEHLLKEGKLRCLVATSSLELGIDVGHVDLVIQIDSPKSVAAAIQRFGRAGHAVGGISRGVLLARTRGELAEAAVLARAAAARDIETIRVPRHHLDVLSQQVVAMTATDDWEVGRLAAVLARSDGFHGLRLSRLLAALSVLSGLYPFARPLLAWDRDAGLLRRRPGTPMAAIMGAGTIPPSGGYPVHHAETRVHVGELDEEFVHETRVGDVFQLGASSWTVRAIRPDRVYVTEAVNRSSDIPFWNAQPVSRSYELSKQVGDFLEEMTNRLAFSTIENQEWLERSCMMDASASLALIQQVKSQAATCGVPTSRKIIMEHYIDDNGRHHLLIHSIFGRRFNHTWLLALQLELEKTVPFSIYAGVRDNGIEFVFPEWDASWLHAISRVDSKRLEELLLHALPSSPLFGIHFRRIAEVSLLLTRSFTRVPLWKQRMRGEELLRESLPYADQFPYVREALQEAMEESLSIPEVKEMLDAIARGDIGVEIMHTRFPSPMATDFMLDYVMGNIYESDAVSRDLQAQVIGVSREMAEELFGAESIHRTVSPTVVKEEQQRLEEGLGVKAEHAEDVYRLLKERGDRTRGELLRLMNGRGATLIEALEQEGRILTLSIGGEERLICSDEKDIYERFPLEKQAVLFVLQRYMDHRISFTAADIVRRYRLSTEHANQLISEWRKDSRLERAPFAESAAEEIWTSSKVASRIVKYSLQQFRQQAEPVPATRYASYLADIQGIQSANGAVGQLQSGSVEALRDRIARLEGMFLPVSHWESFLLPSRFPGYRKDHLDLLCASGDVMWIGRRVEGEKEGRVAFFLTESKDLYTPFLQSTNETRHPDLLALLRGRGASFLSALSRETGEIPSQTLERLLELVWEGHAANDQFAPLRMKTTAAKKMVKAGTFQSGLGRWYAVSSLASMDKVGQGGGGATSGGASDSEERSLVAWTKHLLDRFGMVTRDIVSAYSPFAWDKLYGGMKRLEEWGMLTRGFFIEGIPVMQFATKDTVEYLRSAGSMAEKRVMLLPASDPANPYGTIVPWPDKPGVSFARKSTNYLLLYKENWELWIENGGKRMQEMSSSIIEQEEQLTFAMKSLLQLGKMKKIQVEEWNGIRASGSPVASLLEKIGAERDRDMYVLWPSSFHRPF